jgi:hypothetical protein
LKLLDIEFDRVRSLGVQFIHERHHLLSPCGSTGTKRQTNERGRLFLILHSVFLFDIGLDPIDKLVVLEFLEDGESSKHLVGVAFASDDLDVGGEFGHTVYVFGVLFHGGLVEIDIHRFGVIVNRQVSHVGKEGAGISHNSFPLNMQEEEGLTTFA